jgi:DNA polymerase
LTVVDRSDFNETVDGLIKRFELLRAYGVVDAPVVGEKVMVFSSSGKKGARVAFVIGSPEGEKKQVPLAKENQELIERIINSIALEKEDVYICTVARRRPTPGDATMAEFEKEIKRVSPRVIVTFGEQAARLVLDEETPLAELRGRFHSYGTIKVIPTHHTSTLIKNPGLKRETWEDMKMVIKVLAEGT